MEPYEFTDPDGDKLVIKPALAAGVIRVYITGDGDESDWTFVLLPAHRLAAVVSALYEAAGQPVPDLPVIHDQAEVNRLADLVHFAREGTRGYCSFDFDIARVLLAHGVRLPEVAK